VDALSGKKKKKKGKFVSLLKEAEMKKMYADMINKKLDNSAAKLKDSTDAFFNGQKHRVMGELAKKKTKESQKKITADAILKYDKEVGLATEFILPYIEKYLKDSAQEALNLVAPQEDFHDSKKIQKIIQKRSEKFAESVNSTTLEKLDKTLAEGISAGEGIRELSDRVESVYEEFPSYRSELIARTEATVANNEGALEGFRQSEVATGKEWINAGDARVREEHQDGVGVGGEIVALDSDFSNGLSYPQEPNCRCVIGPAFIED
jgi:SPP1 gp7 family putative phage head morphogenesis protein